MCFKRGDEWWLPIGQDVEVQRGRVSQHPWTERVMHWVDNLPEVTATEILTSALELPAKDQTDGAKAIVGKILRTYGWIQTCTTRKGQRMRLWRKSGSELPRPDLDSI